MNDVIDIDWVKFDNPDKYPEYRTLDKLMIAVKFDGYELAYIDKNHQTPELCVAALNRSWHSSVFDYIKIPIEGDFLKEINRMKLFKGPLK